MAPRIRVVGGGMVGLAFAVAVKDAIRHADVAVLEARSLPTGTPDPLDTRASALNLASRDILRSLEVWPALNGHSGVIRKIHVSNQRRFGSALMDASDVGADCLGFVCENHIIGRALKSQADTLGVAIRAPMDVTSVSSTGGLPVFTLGDGEAMAADLVIVADGGDSRLRGLLGISVDRNRSGQSAIVANVAFMGAQADVAFERFTAEGPLALLPLPTVQRGEQRFNLVWSAAEDRAAALLERDDAGFLAALQEAFGWRLGELLKVGRRNVWPLERVRAAEQIRPGIVIAGNAAHGIHPVAGQGLNLSLRDAITLAATLQSAALAGERLGSPDVLARYLRATESDQSRTIQGTDLLSTLFSRRGLLLDGPRDAALAALDLLPPMRRQIARIGTAADFQLPANQKPASFGRGR